MDSATDMEAYSDRDAVSPAHRLTVFKDHLKTALLLLSCFDQPALSNLKADAEYQSLMQKLLSPLTTLPLSNVAERMHQVVKEGVERISAQLTESLTHDTTTTTITPSVSGAFHSPPPPDSLTSQVPLWTQIPRITPTESNPPAMSSEEAAKLGKTVIREYPERMLTIHFLTGGWKTTDGLIEAIVKGLGTAALPGGRRDIIAAWRRNVPPVTAPPTPPSTDNRIHIPSRQHSYVFNDHPRIVLACRSAAEFFLNEIESVDLSSFWTEDAVVCFRVGRRREYGFRVTGFSPDAFLQNPNHPQPINAAVAQEVREGRGLDVVPERLVQPKSPLALGLTYSLRRIDPSSLLTMQTLQNFLYRGKRKVNLYVQLYSPAPSIANPLKRMRLEEHEEDQRTVDCSAFFEPFRLDDTFDFV